MAKKILIIEDDEFLSQLMSKKISDEEFEYIDYVELGLETYNDKKREETLKDMIVEINSTNDEEKLNHIGEKLDYLINIIKMSSK
jgi:hypothetical protein